VPVPETTVLIISFSWTVVVGALTSLWPGLQGTEREPNPEIIHFPLKVLFAVNLGFSLLTGVPNEGASWLQMLAEIPLTLIAFYLGYGAVWAVKRLAVSQRTPGPPS
jgi:hypothetical protein